MVAQLGHKAEIIGSFPRNLYRGAECALAGEDGEPRGCVQGCGLFPACPWLRADSVPLGYISSLLYLFTAEPHKKRVENLSWARDGELQTKERIDHISLFMKTKSYQD